jgi:hypothetical protein
MQRDDPPRTEPKELDEEAKRNAALARYDAHPAIAVLLLATMVFLLIVVAYQFVSDRPAPQSRQGAELQAPQR